MKYNRVLCEVALDKEGVQLGQPLRRKVSAIMDSIAAGFEGVCVLLICKSVNKPVSGLRVCLALGEGKSVERFGFLSIFFLFFFFFGCE